MDFRCWCLTGRDPLEPILVPQTSPCESLPFADLLYVLFAINQDWKYSRVLHSETLTQDTQEER